MHGVIRAIIGWAKETEGVANLLGEQFLTSTNVGLVSIYCNAFRLTFDFDHVSFSNVISQK